MAVTGWWFILWLWAPIYGNILAVQLFQPIWATLKWTWPTGGAAWFGTHNGVFVVTLITIALAGRPGLHRNGRIREGPALVLHRRHDRLRRHRDPAADQLARRLHRRVQPGRQHLFGVKNAYAATNHAAAKAGYTTSPIGFGPLGPTMLLVPALMFFLLWPNWGTTLYGEVRGASDFRRVFSGMFIGLWITVLFTVIFLLLMAKTVRLGLLPEPQLAGLQPSPRSSASGRTRSCSLAGWSTTPRSR